MMEPMVLRLLSVFAVFGLCAATVQLSAEWAPVTPAAIQHSASLKEASPLATKLSLASSPDRRTN